MLISDVIAGLQSHAQTAATGRGRVGQVNTRQADEDPPRGGAIQPRRDRREEGGHQTECEGRRGDAGPGHGEH